MKHLRHDVYQEDKKTQQVAQRSRELWEAEFYCAESVLSAVSEAAGIRSRDICGEYVETAAALAWKLIQIARGSRS